jgi:hypothetical protein
MRLVALALLASSGCAAVVLPPSQTEIGPALVARGGGQRATGVRFSTGAHWASSTAPDPTIDVGVGYVAERTEEAPAILPPAGDTEPVLASGPVATADEARFAHGSYLDVARRILAGRHHRAWVSLRGQALWSSGRQGAPDLGVAARLSWELHGVGSGAGSFTTRCGGGFGVAAGRTAVGGYVETGYRVSPEGIAELTSTAGLSFRLPFIAGMAFDLCPR